VAADDGVMPQTIEHVRVLRALGIDRGVVAVTRADLTDPAAALGAAAALMPDAPAVACSARTGIGIEPLRRTLATVAATVPARPACPAPAVLHVDRVFSIRGAGTVVTGTLWRGTVGAGEHMTLLPQERSVRIRGVQVHDAATAVAGAGQRVALNLAGVERHAVRRGDALVSDDSPVAATYRAEVRLLHGVPPEDHERVQVHHGTRDAPARVRRLSPELWQLRLEQPLLAADGDRFVLRRISPPDTLGGGIMLRADAGGHRARTSPPAPADRRAPRPPALVTLDPGALALEQRLRAAAHQPLSTAELGDDAPYLPALREVGRAIRVGRAMYAHPDTIDAVTDLVCRIIEQEQEVTLARLRDELGTSRKYAQALLEHLDAARITRRLPDDRRVLRGRRSQDGFAGRQ